MRTRYVAVLLLGLTALASVAVCATLPPNVKTDAASVQRMLQADPGVTSARDASGKTLLILAVRKGQVDAVRLLLDKGADPNAADNSGKTALHWVAFECRPTLRGESAKANSYAIAQALVAKNPNINTADRYNNTPLHYAAWFGCTKFSKLLINNGASLTATNVKGRTPLCQAAFRGNLDEMRLLLDNGASVKAQTPGGCTPAACVAAGHATPDVKKKALAMLSRQGDR